MILLTTSDYFPQLGGLSTFTANLEKVFKELNLDYEVFHWKKFSDIKKISNKDLTKYSLIVNVHSHVGLNSLFQHNKVVNFIHGSEALFTSPNIIKKIIKKFYFKKKYFSFLEGSFFNVFISEATLKKTMTSGLTPDYSRDLVIHNGIEIKNVHSVIKKLDSKIVFTCIARNVPHKNISGAIRFCEIYSNLTKKKVQIILPSGVEASSSQVEIVNLKNSTDEIRNAAFLKAHFNLLLSLDHSHQGFYEGFGLTTLEAAQFSVPSVVLNTGGLPEAVHHKKTGWVLSKINEDEVGQFLNFFDEVNYKKICFEAYRHTKQSHSLESYKLFFKMISDVKVAS